jgi:60 kDa SS-A/Ro ribonucleoprotein
MTGLVQHVSTRKTPQSAPIPGREPEMAKNAAGGYAFTIGDWERLRRFLILGSEGGTYYATEQKLTVENAEVVRRCAGEDGLRTVATIVSVSQAGLAPRNDAAILALALTAKTGDERTRRAAYDAVPTVCRTGTHLFQFAEAIEALGGWGRGARRAITQWYAGKEPDALAYQLVKYRQRNGWTHRDLLRLTHPRPQDEAHDALYAWLRGAALTEGQEAVYQRLWPEAGGLPRLIEGFTALLEPGLYPEGAAVLIREYGLPWEAVPSHHAKDPGVMMALLESMPVTATLRQLGRYGAAGLLSPFSGATTIVLNRLRDTVALRKARVHPMAVLLALKTYAQGHGMRGEHAWKPVQGIVDALDQAFYDTIPNVPTTGKRLLVAIDVSGSMSMQMCAGYPISATESAAAMALITMRVEPNHHVIGFHTSASAIPVSPRQRLDDVLRVLRDQPSGGTDLAMPVLYAEHLGLELDGILVLTDNETWAGAQHPAQALQRYRGPNPGVRLVNAAMTATGTSTRDPKDPLTLECIGLDASMSGIAAGFIAGEV